MGAAIVTGLTGVVVAVLQFAAPQTPRLVAPDAIVVLSGGQGERLDLGLRLAAQHPGATLVISNGERDGWPTANALCADASRPTRCFQPRPQTTTGEARAIARLAGEEGWQRLAVVTSTYHVTRTRVAIEQCIGHPVWVVPAGFGTLGPVARTEAVVHEVVATAATITISPAC